MFEVQSEVTEAIFSSRCCCVVFVPCVYLSRDLLFSCRAVLKPSFLFLLAVGVITRISLRDLHTKSCSRVF
jgi:hypothetical protein